MEDTTIIQLLSCLQHLPYAFAARQYFGILAGWFEPQQVWCFLLTLHDTIRAVEYVYLRLAWQAAAED